jgi:hypothetical protein
MGREIRYILQCYMVLYLLSSVLLSFIGREIQYYIIMMYMDPYQVRTYRVIYPNSNL